ncbi:DUF5329 domain-containing protein [Massilia sp. CF038]|uniref:DUF5329 domain-containing protein n=1 Tax=Massilia sp. CF038 TaxID=1881045 RepID=UPI000918A256|nr:DUF5329 domain-containing protein [Massilia sp. CF038]SHH27100.1 hypothetical protein SAMN05428948_3609 [Massilia sp. CF038]
MKAWILIGALLFGSHAIAATPAATRTEVTQLMAAVDKSGCKFSRNGSWYSAAEARAHLQKKFDYLDKKDMLTTTESFIEKGASTSSMSGKPYEMQCPGKPAVSSAAWLTAELTRLRQK